MIELLEVLSIKYFDFCFYKINPITSLFTITQCTAVLEYTVYILGNNT